MRFTLQPCRIANFYHEGEGGTISLLSVKFLSMANDVSFSLQFDEVEEMEKTFRDNGISAAHIL